MNKSYHSYTTKQNVCMSATSAPKTTFFIFYITISVAYNVILRITDVIYIKIKKFIIYSIYFANMQTFCKKLLFYAVLQRLHMSATSLFVRPHLF